MISQKKENSLMYHVVGPKAQIDTKYLAYKFFMFFWFYLEKLVR